MRALPLFASLLLIGPTACSDDAPPAPTWEVVLEDLPGALLSVWGTATDDIWAVGADARDGTGPMVLHYDGSTWDRVDTGQTEGSLWWVFGFEGGPVYMGGENGLMLRYAGSAFEVMTTPTSDTVFGIWGANPSDVWAVGGLPSSTGFAWRLRGDAWEAEPMVPADVMAGSAVWKVFGTSANDVWLVGENGVGLSYDGSTLVRGDTGVGSSLFTVHANADRYAAVGGSGNAVIVEHDGAGWHNVTPDDAFIPGLAGVCLGSGESGVAVGLYGSVLERGAAGWAVVDLSMILDQNLHGVWIDPSGGVWAVGGQTLSARLNEGTLIHRPGNP